MKKDLFLILAASIITIMLTGCYTMLDIPHDNLSADDMNNTEVIYYPVPINNPIPHCPTPLRPLIAPQPYDPVSINKPTTIKTLIRDNNGGRRDESGNAVRTPSQERRSSIINDRTGSTQNSNTASNNSRNSNDRNNSSSRSGNTVRNNNGGRQ